MSNFFDEAYESYLNVLKILSPIGVFINTLSIIGIIGAFDNEEPIPLFARLRD